MPPNLIVTTALLVVCAFILCNGLMIQYNKNARGLRVGPTDPPNPSCGVLTCQEDISRPLGGHVKKSGLTQAVVHSAEKILSLSIYKTNRPRTPVTGNIAPDWKGINADGVITETLVGRVTEANKTLSVLTDILTASGSLAQDKALLSMELFTHDVCRPETFTCRVHYVDISGKIFTRQLSTQDHGYKGQKNVDVDSRQSAGTEYFKLGRGQKVQSDTESWVLEGTIHLIGLVEQLQLKMAVMEKTVEEIKVEGQLLDEIKDKIVVLDAIMQKVSEIDSIKEKVSSVQDIRDKVLVMSAKLSSMEGVKDKLMDVNEKLAEIQASREITPMLEKLQANMLSMELEVGKRLSAIRQEFTRFRENITDLVVDSIASANDNIMSSITGGFSKCESSEKPVEALVDKVEIWFDNVTSDLRDGLQDSLLKFAETQRNTMEDLASTWNNSSATCELYQAVVTDVKNLESSLKNLIEPLACEKGMHALDRYVTIPGNQPGSLVQAPFLCDTVTLGGGWIVFQRRVNGDVDFYRGWQEYKTGFGSTSTDYWLGLENIHKVTSSGAYELRIDLKHNGISAYAQYAKFSVASETENYKLFVASYSGTAGDSLIARHSGKGFSTRDRDNDASRSEHCAVERTGAWWYDACTDSNLNGKWQEGNWDGLAWEELADSMSVDFSEMKMRKVT